MLIGLTLLVAHQGGWDEVLLVAGPVLFVVALLVLANRRVKKQLAEMSPVADSDES